MRKINIHILRLVIISFFLYFLEKIINFKTKFVIIKDKFTEVLHGFIGQLPAFVLTSSYLPDNC